MIAIQTHDSTWHIFEPGTFVADGERYLTVCAKDESGKTVELGGVAHGQVRQWIITDPRTITTERKETSR